MAVAGVRGPEGLPRRIILSRKGSDASWGGRPSVRLGRELISLPIPESAPRAAAAEATGRGTRYGDLPHHRKLGALHRHLRGLAATDYVHLDPDVRPELRPARGDAAASSVERLFGQEGAAERHLRNQEVGPGDLFLFFGWFRECVELGDEWKRRGPDEHCLWGWLQVESTHAIDSEQAAAAVPWAAHHPHVAHWDRYDRHNRLYRARDTLSFAPHLPGAGVFRWHPALTLSQRCDPQGQHPTRGAWCLPDFFRRAGLTYNHLDGPPCTSRRRHVHLHAAPIGQEFVAPAHRPFRRSEQAALGAWLTTLFQGSSAPGPGE